MSVLKTPLFDCYSEHGGKVVEFAGWALPVQYRDGRDAAAISRTTPCLPDAAGAIHRDGSGGTVFGWGGRIGMSLPPLSRFYAVPSCSSCD